VLAGAPIAALWGPSPVTRASGRCLDVVRVLRITQGAPAVEAVALRCQGLLEALRGRTDAARRMIASSRRLVEELGITQRLLEADVFAGLIELLEGDAVAAERCLRPAYEGLRSHGLGIDAAQAAALLGRALLALDRGAEAEALSHESEALAGDDLKAAIAWRGVRAEALARRGEHVAAVDFARAAVEIAAATDALLDHADARRALATALRAAGRSGEADSEEARAIELWDTKGATLLAERARRDAAPLAHPHRSRTDPIAPVRAARLRVRPNAATANAATLDAAFAARDADVFATLVADVVEVVHHPTGVIYDRQGTLDAWHMLLGAQDLAFAHEPLATVGEALALFRTSVSFSALPENIAPVGAASWDEVLLIEVDGRGQRCRVELFAPNRLGDAIVRLYERYADLLPDGPERACAAATARAVVAALAPLDVDRLATALAPDIKFIDHRRLGLPPLSGAEAVLRGIRSVHAAARDITTCVLDVLALRCDALLVRWTEIGTESAGGGEYERRFLRLTVFGSDALLAHLEHFDTEALDEALARFDKLTIAPSAARFTNAATRAIERFEHCWSARDWDGVVATFAPTHVMDDRRARVHLQLAGEDYFTSLKIVFDELRSSRWTYALLATRGDRLALFRVELTGEAAGSGPMVSELFCLVGVDSEGRREALVTFDLGAADAAYAELDARYAAGEAASCGRVSAAMHAFVHAFSDRDWGTVAAQFASELVAHDHRLLGWETLRGPAAYVQALRSLVDLAPEARLRLDHVRMSERGQLWVAAWLGTREGGAFEAPWIVVSEHDTLGRVMRFDQYDLDQQDEARGRFAAISARPDTPPTPRIENAATRTVARVDAASEAHDWQRVTALFQVGFRASDRRRMVLLEIDREPYLESLRPFFEMAATTNEVLATRGNRLALLRTRWIGSNDTVGPSAGEFILVVEVDDSGSIVALVILDVDDLDAAYAELDARYAAGEGAAYRSIVATWHAFAQALAARDWDALAAVFAPDLVVYDHRPLGWDTMRGPAVFVETFKSLVDLAPDVRLRTDHVTMSAHRRLGIATWLGTREGGPFEAPRAVVVEHDASGRIRREDFYNLDQLDLARARFEAMGASVAPDPLCIPPNAGTRVMDRWQEACEARDWGGLTILAAPTLVFEDRRRLTRTVGDRDMLVASTRLIVLSGARMSRRVLAASGEHLVLEHLWMGSDNGVVYESEALFVTEVDVAGRMVAVIVFDPDDRRAASREMLARYARGEGARSIPASAFELIGAMNDHDLGRCRAALGDDFVFHDHRRTGVGRIESVDAYVAWLGALFAQSPDAIVEPLYYIATEPHGFLAIGHTVGTNISGGPFESVFVQLVLNQGARIVGAELFELEDLDAARARFADLRSDPVRIPPNTACYVRDRVLRSFEADDWQTLRSLMRDDFTFEDRRKRALLSGDVDLWIKNADFILSAHMQHTRTVIGTNGDRIALECVVWVREREDGASEIEFIRLVEIDAEGRLAAWIYFDVDDRGVAFAEAQARFVAGEAAAVGGQAPIAAFSGACAHHEWQRARGCLANDLLVRDHTTLGLGTVRGGEFVEALQTQSRLSNDVSGEVLRIFVWSRDGRVDVVRVSGTIFDGGGPFEKVYVRVILTDRDCIRCFEVYDPGDVERALARFEELCRENSSTAIAGG